MCTPAKQPYRQMCHHVAAPPRRVRTEWPSVRGPSCLIFNFELTERISDDLRRSERRQASLPNTFLPSVAVGFSCGRSQCRYSALSLPSTLTKRDESHKNRHEPIKVIRVCILPSPSVICEYYCSCILLAVRVSTLQNPVVAIHVCTASFKIKKNIRFADTEFLCFFGFKNKQLLLQYGTIND